MEPLTDRELQSLRNMGNEAERAADEIERLRIGHERYETARRMNPQQWAAAWKLNLSSGKPFDQIIDEMRPFMRPTGAARLMGERGGEHDEAERLAFEAWMAGHCWSLGNAIWNGRQYVAPIEKEGFVDSTAMRTRQLWAAWRDRAALARAAGGTGGA